MNQCFYALSDKMRSRIWWHGGGWGAQQLFLSQFSLSAACLTSPKSINLQAGAGGMKSHPSKEKIRFETFWGSTNPWHLKRCIPGSWGNWLMQERQGPVRAGPKQKKLSEGWNIFCMKTGWEIWGCSSWKREGVRKTLLLLFSTWRGITGKMERHFLPRPVVTGQG